MKTLFSILLVCFPLLLSAQKTKLAQLQFITTSGQVLNQQKVPKGQALLLAYFRTDCDYCRHSALQIKTQAASYPAFIWMISPEESDIITIFEEMNGLYSIPGLVVGRDHSKSMHDWFQFEAIPFYVLFDDEGKQVGSFGQFPSSTEIQKLLSK